MSRTSTKKPEGECMAVPSPMELGNNSVAIGIDKDKDKSSQWAVKWAVEHILRGRNCKVILVHVKNYTSPYHSPYSPKTGRAPTEFELHHLFLSFRGFCARKGFETHEVVLHDHDVSSALVGYIQSNSIGTIVVGASTRNAFTRHFRHTDVPTSLAKAAPDFCTVYVISKGKVQSVRSSNPSGAPRTPKTPASSRSSPADDSSQYFSAINYSINYTTSASSGSDDRSLQAPESPDLYPIPGTLSKNSSNGSSYYNARLKTMLGQPPAHPHRSNSFDDNSRDSYSREDQEHDDMDHFPWNSESARTPPRFMQSSSPTPRIIQSPSPSTRVMSSPQILTEPGHNLPYVRSMLSDGSNTSTSNGSFESSDYSYDLSSYTSTSSHSSYLTSYAMENELDAEIKRLKHETEKTMDLFQSITDQATTAKHQADKILNQEHTIEEIKVARQAELIVADLERLKTKAAMDAANMAVMLAELEAEKRKFVKQRGRNKDGPKRETSTFCMTHRIYSYEEIEVATNYFSTSQQIGEGGYGPVYRAMLQHTPVAIKVLKPDVSQGLQQFQKEIEVLGRIRHPNMVLLLGACPQYGCLVYEYMDNGSLEDRLFCKNNTPPIPWRARFKIAAEITTALLFLHQTKPNPMVHRDLKPANILLDANYTSKIADVGLARLVPPTVANEMTQYHMTAAAGTFCYIDPEYQQTGLLGTKSDVYSLGVMLLQLITAKPAMALAYNVEEAIENGEFANMLDPAIPDWPIEQALCLAKLALKCCELRKKDRPDLESVVLPTLNTLRDFALCS